MKSATFILGIAVWLAHTADPAESLSIPLSMFRDGPAPSIGYAIFLLMLLIAGLMIHALHSARMDEHTFLFSLASLLLFLVAVTPSDNDFHALCSFALLALLYGYYAVVLRNRLGSACCWAHVIIPVLLLLAIRLHSYGLWQKCLVGYFLLAINIHYHVLARRPRERSGNRPRGHSAGYSQSQRRRKWVLEPGQAWTRTKGPQR